ncbi:hypothetical protein QF20_001284 [Salmonella enterica subsp. enterica]|uniref:Uncharacterized protein n=1 Tax=Salmonella enterica TaxID=28901 RepID=A0A749ZCM9_SALER|nr:hypothetical protein [Salmonella enterica subsp. enterica serovar Mikawasima]HAF6043975.1 hypothetical protein [Salmonella enterica]EBR0172662.1 hypothetical protein [Salmonella enterica subsp. enterica serovar Mikawasima]EBS3158095.1 hypothetical protein [Salmonella enterica subsp. enterica serovar Mikawasima]EDW0319802.1 hypothetical protein [Salmonella enterica subsp. enterica serovar Mikawasima]
MTDANNGFNEDIYQSFCELRASVDALAAAAHLIPHGGEDESLGCLFRVLSERLEADLTAHFQSMRGNFCRSHSPESHDL